MSLFLCLSVCVSLFVSLFLCLSFSVMVVVMTTQKNIFCVHFLTDVFFLFLFICSSSSFSFLLLSSSFLFIEQNRVGLQSWLSLLFSFVSMHLKLHKERHQQKFFYILKNISVAQARKTRNLHHSLSAGLGVRLCVKMIAFSC